MSDNLYCIDILTDITHRIYRCDAISVLDSGQFIRFSKRKPLKCDKTYTVIRVRLSTDNVNEFIHGYVFKSRKKAAKQIRNKFINDPQITKILGKNMPTYTKNELATDIAYYVNRLNRISLQQLTLKLDIDVFEGKLVSGNCPLHIHSNVYKCSICIDKESNVAIVPCGHICGCFDCLNNSRISECPICRMRKGLIVKVYQAGLCETDI
jgi:hypothetical protein